jgi:hypothetical protein
LRDPTFFISPFRKTEGEEEKKTNSAETGQGGTEEDCSSFSSSFFSSFLLFTEERKRTLPAVPIATTTLKHAKGVPSSMMKNKMNNGNETP